MAVITIPRALSDKLGEEATDALVDVINKIEPDNGKIKAELTKELVTRDIFDERMKSLESKIESFVTKAEFLEESGKTNERITRVEGELKLMRWMMGIIIAGVVSLIMKAFFM